MQEQIQARQAKDASDVITSTIASKRIQHLIYLLTRLKTMRSIGSLSVTIALVALTASTVSAQSCTVCGNAANNFTKPTAKYNKLTCQQLQDSLTTSGEANLCSEVLTGDKYSWFQHESFCGCVGAQAPETCQICADDEIVAFPTSYVPWDQEEERYTCAEAVELARHVSDSTVCTNVVATPAVKQTCCRKIGEVCPLCTMGGNFIPDNRYKNITCGALQQETFALDSVQCKAYYGRDTHYWMNWETFCGCENAVVPNKPCTLCGSSMEVSNPDAIAPWVNETDVYTCKQADELARHISDNSVCIYDVQTPEVLAACCGPIGGVMSAASTPLGMVSASAGFMMALLMLAM